MHTVIVFESKHFGSIRTFVEEGRQEPWFDSTDVLRALGISSSAMRCIDENEKLILRLTQDDRNRAIVIVCVSKSGLYALARESRKPEAKLFARMWDRFYGGNGFEVRCLDCGYIGELGKTRAAAVRAWNNDEGRKKNAGL